MRTKTVLLKKSSRKEGEIPMEEIPEIQEDLGNGGKFKNWLQDNVRIILSVLIVVAIAAGIYSYSKRSETPMTSEEIALEEVQQQEGDEAVTIIGEEDEDVASEDEDTMTEEDVQQEEVVNIEETPATDVKVEEATPSTPVSMSEETGEAFVQTAVSGDSVTTLSRKALRNYLEKNNDSSLTAEHKIYIEDYMRKHVGHTGSLHVGDQVTFSKTLIKNAIEQSKTLNDRQLENLKKYSARVSGI